MSATNPNAMGYKQFAANSGWALATASHEATTTESTFTFTLREPLTMDDHSMLVLVMDLQVTAALTLLLRINGSSASLYFTDGARIAGGAETLIDGSTDTSAELCNTALTAAANGLCGKSEIFLMKGAGTDAVHILSNYSSQEGVQNVRNMFLVDTATIASVTVLTSTSTWASGSRMSLYKVSRLA